MPEKTPPGEWITIKCQGEGVLGSSMTVSMPADSGFNLSFSEIDIFDDKQPMVIPFTPK